MAGLSFFNPAVFAPSADVAVRPAPASDYSPIAAAISDSMKYVQDTVKKKRDLDNLKEETLQLANYVAPQSQPLSIYLKDQANSYDLFTTDPGRARADLLKNTLGFLGVENQRIRALQDANTQRFENQYKYKLTAAGNQYERLLRDRQKWEAEENDRYMAHERNRIAASSKGITIPVYVKRPYPDNHKIVEADQNLRRLENMTQQDVEQMSIVSGGRGGLGNVDPFNRQQSQSVQNPPLPSENDQDTSSQAPAAFENPEPYEDKVVNVDTGLLDPANVPQERVRPPMLAAINKAVSEVPLTENTPANSEPSSILFPNIASADAGGDEITRQALENRASFQRRKQEALADIDDIMDRLDRSSNRRFYEEQELAELNKLISKRDAIKKQIDGIGNVGSEEWQRQVNRINRKLNEDIEAIPRNTIAQTDKKNIEKNSGTVMLKIANDRQGGTIPAIRTLKDGKIRYLAENVQTGKMDEDVTSRVVAGQLIPQTEDFALDPNNPVNIRPAANNVIPTPGSNSVNGNTRTNVITPGTSMPSVIEALKKKGTQ